MDHDRFTGWDRNVISKNNDITDNGGEEQGRGYKKRKNETQKNKDIISILQPYECEDPSAYYCGQINAPTVHTEKLWYNCSGWIL